MHTLTIAWNEYPALDKPVLRVGGTVASNWVIAEIKQAHDGAAHKPVGLNSLLQSQFILLQRLAKTQRLEVIKIQR
jgi:hypothetical protein